MRTVLEHAIWIPLEGIINQLLSKSNSSQSQLGQYEGKHIRIGIQSTTQFDILILSQGIRLGRFTDSQPHAEIHAPKQAFLALLSSPNKREQLESSQFELLTDPQLILEIADIMGALSLDWSRLLQPYIGEFATQKLHIGMTSLKNLGKQTSIIPKIFKDFLEQEKPHLASAEAMQERRKQILELNKQAQKLSERVDALIQSKSKKAEKHG